MDDELERHRQRREREREEAERRLDDTMVKVARDVLGTRASAAVRAGLDALRDGASQEEADQVASRWLREHPVSDLDHSQKEER